MAGAYAVAPAQVQGERPTKKKANKPMACAQYPVRQLVTYFQDNSPLALLGGDEPFRYTRLAGRQRIRTAIPAPRPCSASERSGTSSGLWPLPWPVRSAGGTRCVGVLSLRATNVRRCRFLAKPGLFALQTWLARICPFCGVSLAVIPKFD